jgi:hypothetical protein
MQAEGGSSRAIRGLASGLTVMLTAAAFWLSYAHLHQVAAGHGLGREAVRSWAWPGTVDLFIAIGELLTLRASLARQVDWWAIGLTVIGSGGSIAFNVAGVGPGASTLDYVVAAVPPVAALLAFGALMRQVRGFLSRDVVSRDEIETGQDETPPEPPRRDERSPVVPQAETPPVVPSRTVAPEAEGGAPELVSGRDETVTPLADETPVGLSRPETRTRMGQDATTQRRDKTARSGGVSSRGDHRQVVGPTQAVRDTLSRLGRVASWDGLPDLVMADHPDLDRASVRKACGRARRDSETKALAGTAS